MKAKIHEFGKYYLCYWCKRRPALMRDDRKQNNSMLTSSRPVPYSKFTFPTIYPRSPSGLAIKRS